MINIGNDRSAQAGTRTPDNGFRQVGANVAQISDVVSA